MSAMLTAPASAPSSAEKESILVPQNGASALLAE